MTGKETPNRRRLPPSKLAPKILCKAYVPSEFPIGREGERLRWKHSDEMVGVAKHLLESDFQLTSFEAPLNGGRIDLVVRAPDGQKVGVEVKSHRGELRELDKIQGALYWTPQLDRIAVANRRAMLFLTPEYVGEVKTAGNMTAEFLEKQPDLASVTYTPHKDVCRTCRNRDCPYLRNPSFSYMEEGFTD
jgi:Holliday junction resolvase-like predicted endonuclease